jgi:hypothetical protein
LLEERAAGLDGRHERMAEIDPLHAERHLAMPGARDVEEIVHQAADLLRLAPHHPGDPGALGPGIFSLDEEIGRQEDRGERVAQLVTEHGEELVLALDLVAQELERARAFEQLGALGHELFGSRLELRLGAPQKLEAARQIVGRLLVLAARLQALDPTVESFDLRLELSALHERSTSPARLDADTSGQFLSMASQCPRCKLPVSHPRQRA